jgi:hypothetical protein
MAAAEAGAAEVVFTDAEEARPVLDRLRSSVAQSLGDSGSGRYRVQGFTWGRLPAFLMDPHTPPPEVLLAADCLYDSSRTRTRHRTRRTRTQRVHPHISLRASWWHQSSRTSWPA